MGNLKILFVSTLFIFTLYGCSSEQYSTKSESIEFIENSLHDKYDEHYVVIEDTVVFEKSLLMYSVNAQAYNVDKPESEFEVYSTSNGYLKDDYAKVYYEDEVQQEVTNFCKQKNYIADCKGEIVSPMSTENCVKNRVSYDDYRDKHGAIYNVYVKGNDVRKYPEEYVDPIFEMQEDILNNKYNDGHLIVYYGDIRIFDKIYVLEEDDFIIPDKATIKKNIIRNVFSYDYNQKLINDK